jgi:hypothetical protein
MANNFRVRDLYAENLNLTNRPFVNGTGVLLSGEIVSQSEATGVSGFLQSQIDILSGQTGDYTLHSETGAFYSSSNPSGFITGIDLSSYGTIEYITGVSGFLQDEITNLYNQTGDYVLKSNTGEFLTTGAADNRYVDLSSTQTIYGTKNFSNDVYINHLYVTGSETLVNVTNSNVQSPYLILNLTGGAVDGGIFFVTGSGLTGINDSGAIIGFDHSDKFKFGISTRANDLSSLSTIGSVEQITGLSGHLQPQITSLNDQTGNYTLHSETGVFYATSNPSGFITGVDLSTYATTQYVTGVSGLLQTQIIDLQNQTVYITGDQIISGVKTFISRPTVNGTGILLSGEASGGVTESYVTGISGSLQVQITSLSNQTGNYAIQDDANLIIGISVFI